jgi:hypothetical protein
MSGRVRVEWMNVPTSGRKKYRTPMMKTSQAKNLPIDGPRRGLATVAAAAGSRAVATVSTASG